MNRKYTRPAHYGWVQKVKDLFPAAEIDEAFRFTNSFIEITVKKSETVELGLKLMFNSEKEKDKNGEGKEQFIPFGHISCICGTLLGVRKICVIDVLGWDQAISDFQTIMQKLNGSETSKTVEDLFDDLKKSKSVA